MRLLIIVTHQPSGKKDPPYDLYDCATSWSSGYVSKIETKTTSTEDGDIIVLVLEDEVASKVNRFLQGLLKAWQGITEIYVAAHGGAYNAFRSLMGGEKELKQVVRLSHEERDQLYKAIKSLIKSPTGDNFTKVLEAMKPNLVRRLSILKHRIAHLFLPIDIDLQGLMETGFREDYWKEVADAWRGGKALGTLTEARKLVYGSQGVEDSVKKVVEDAKSSTTDNKKRQEIETKWQQVQNILPQSGNLPNNEVNQILQDLGCQCGRDQVKQMCSGKSNPFHQWFAQLIGALDELRDAIEQAQGGGSRRE